MRDETEYRVFAKSEQTARRLMELWESGRYSKKLWEDCMYNSAIDEEDRVYAFDSCCTTCFDAMAEAIRIMHQMELTGEKEEFGVVGKDDIDFGCSLFQIDCSGSEPLIRAASASCDSDYGEGIDPDEIEEYDPDDEKKFYPDDDEESDLNEEEEARYRAFEIARYDAFCGADYSEIPYLLKNELFQTFKQAVDENFALGWFRPRSYEEFYADALADK